MSYQTHFGKNSEAAQAAFIDSIFSITDQFVRRDAIVVLAECALPYLLKNQTMYNIVVQIYDRSTDPFLPPPTIAQLDAFMSFLKDYKSLPIITDYQLRVIGTNNTPTPKTDLERQVDDLKDRVAKLEAIILIHYKN